MKAKMIHTMLRVADLQRSIDFYQRALQLAPTERVEMEDFTLVYLANSESDFELELTFNHGQTTPYSHGSGYGHLAVSVEDAKASHAAIAQQGYAPSALKEFSRDGKVVARFFFVTDPDGYKIEILERLGRFR